MPLVSSENGPYKLEALLAKSQAEAVLCAENKRLMAFVNLLHAYHAASEKHIAFTKFLDDPKWQRNWVIQVHGESFVDSTDFADIFSDERSRFEALPSYKSLCQIGKVQSTYMFDMFERVVCAHLSSWLPDKLPEFGDEPVARISAKMIKTPNAEKEFRRIWWDGDYLSWAKAKAQGQVVSSKEIATSNLYREMNEYEMWSERYEKSQFARPYYAYQMRALAASDGAFTPSTMDVFLDRPPLSLGEYKDLTWKKLHDLNDIEPVFEPSENLSFTVDELEENPIFASIAKASPPIP